MKQKKTSKPVSCRAHFCRAEVIDALGEPEKPLRPDHPGAYYIRRRHIMVAYGFSSRMVTKLVGSETLKEHHIAAEPRKERVK